MRRIGGGIVGVEPAGGMGRPMVRGKTRRVGVAGVVLLRKEKKLERGWLVCLMRCNLRRESCDEWKETQRYCWKTYRRNMSTLIRMNKTERINHSKTD